ncbi:MAG: SGNH/GDSL hydrolase family protein [Deltaproteobacteria bacterium]|nr:SGNH/GDSL hydrolase family protein [Deltaproteobacteria bacterium]
MHRQLHQYHPIIGYHFVPGVKARVEHEGGGYLVRVNQAGFRCDHEFVPHKRPGTFRVLLFGDSYTAGDGVSNRYRYGNLMERAIADLEVYNFGLSGTGTDQQYLIFRQMAADIEHDLIVISVFVENIRRVTARYRPWVTHDGEVLVFFKPYFQIDDDGHLRLHHVPVPKGPIRPAVLPRSEWRHFDQGGRLTWLRDTVNRLGPGAKDLVQRLTRYQPLPAYGQSNSPAWQLMKRILAQWITEATVPVVICPIPLSQHIDETASAASYRARFGELHGPPLVTVHDPLPAFHHFSRSERSQLRFRQDPHFTAAGHRVLAESLGAVVHSFIGQEIQCRPSFSASRLFTTTPPPPL